jgi:hypothetical protein
MAPSRPRKPSGRRQTSRAVRAHGCTSWPRIPIRRCSEKDHGRRDGTERRPARSRDSRSRTSRTPREGPRRGTGHPCTRRRPGRNDYRGSERAAGRPHRCRQQGTDRHQTVPTRKCVEQGLAPRPLQRDDRSSRLGAQSSNRGPMLDCSEPGQPRSARLTWLADGTLADRRSMCATTWPRALRSHEHG